MSQKAVFFITGVIEKITAGSAKLSEDVPCTDIILKVPANTGKAMLYRVTIFEPAVMDDAEKLHPSDTVFVSGTMTGTRNDKGFFNYYLTCRNIFPVQTERRQTNEPKTYTPPRNAYEASKNAPDINTPLPF